MINKQRGIADAFIIITILLGIVALFYFYQSRPASRARIASLIHLARQVPAKDVRPRDQHALARVFRHQSITVNQAMMVKADLQTLIRRLGDQRVLAHFYASHPARRS